MKPKKTEAEKAKFKTVALPENSYNQVKEMAKQERRSIAQQIAIAVENDYQEYSNKLSA
tara:strand:- start:217 stop:393 length:177 start_codon:yes stop_codon:yes gene_type:complete